MTAHEPARTCSPASPCTATSPDPVAYHIRVGGLLDDRWADWFCGLSLSRESDGTTSLWGPVPDQAALHGLLAKIRDLGISLISVEAVDPPKPGIGDGCDL